LVEVVVFEYGLVELVFEFNLLDLAILRYHLQLVYFAVFLGGSCAYRNRF